ncbi:MAG: ribonuclease D [Myxococcota bacterium]
MQLVADLQALERACRALGEHDVYYLDTEFDSGREGTLLCLIQVSGGDQVFLIDALAISDLRLLGGLLGRAGVTWVLHAGQQDLPLLRQRLGIEPARLFDTQLAWALVSIEYSTSLAYLKFRLLGMRGEKTHQADDWRRRPLPETQLAYAADDVAYLPAIYRKLMMLCERRGRVEAAFEASAETLRAIIEPPPPLRLETFRNAWQLEPEGQAVLKFLIDWYNGLTEEDREIAPDAKGLFSLASRRPRSLEDLSSLRAVPRRAAGRFGRALIAGIQRAVASAKTSDFAQIAPPPYAVPEEILASGWLEAVRAEVCVELEMAPELVLPSRVMKKLRDSAVAAGRLEGALDALTGFRRTLLLAPLATKIASYGALKREVD